MEVYLLWHMRPLEGQEDLDPEMDHVETDDKLCGVYSTRSLAESARSQLAVRPGFSRHPDDFLIDEYRVDQLQWAEGFVTDQP
ncbi:hypothetical protein [Modestobacter sp. NPDC049651]|uniref:hypothetical protein n=1 Tax=unclassified Modestobacter TaxID=2643866 RepID=UPI00340973E8